jgi:hypothetical protein
MTVTSSALDLSVITTPLVQIGALVIGAWFARYFPVAIKAVERLTGIMLTTQQEAKVAALIQTSAGALETKIDQGIVKVAHINISNPVVLAEAQAVLAVAGPALANLGVNQDDIAKAIVGAVDTGSRTTPATIPAA